MKIYDQIASNKRKSWLLFMVFFVIMFILGFGISEWFGAGISGVIVIMLFAFIYAAVSFYMGSKIILTVNNAKAVKKKDYPYLFNTVEGLSIAAGIPMPKVYVIDDPSPNAFATGQDPEHSSVAVTKGLLERLDRLELEGVLAHELSHIKDYDIRFTMLVITMVGVIGILSGFISRMFWYFGRGKSRGGGAVIIIAIIVGIFAPLIAQIVKLAISRRREYLADSNGALLTRYPAGLANALRKISNAEPMKLADKTSAPLYIVNPFGKKFVSNLFSTHPPIEDRVNALEKM